jgi:hypothetical protein
VICYLAEKYLGAEAEINLVEAVVEADLVQKSLEDNDMSRVAHPRPH